MSVAAREKALMDFEEQEEVAVMLMSLKAASVGLNLVCANHVLLLDVWWNPTVEDQAIDRAHRLGQRKPVQVREWVLCVSFRSPVWEEDRVKAPSKHRRRLAKAQKPRTPHALRERGHRATRKHRSYQVSCFACFADVLSVYGWLLFSAGGVPARTSCTQRLGFPPGIVVEMKTAL